MSKVKETRAVLLLLVILCSVLVSFPEMGIVKAEPKTIIVPDDYSSIQHAVDNAAEGDTISEACSLTSLCRLLAKPMKQ